MTDRFPDGDPDDQEDTVEEVEFVRTYIDVEEAGDEAEPEQTTAMGAHMMRRAVYNLGII